MATARVNAGKPVSAGTGSDIDRTPTGSDVLRANFLRDLLERVAHLLLLFVPLPLGAAHLPPLLVRLLPPLLLRVCAQLSAGENIPGREGEALGDEVELVEARRARCHRRYLLRGPWG